MIASLSQPSTHKPGDETQCVSTSYQIGSQQAPFSSDRQWGHTSSLSQPAWFFYQCAVAIAVRVTWGSLSCSCMSPSVASAQERDRSTRYIAMLDICYWLSLKEVWQLPNNPHTKSWSPRRTIWGHPGSPPAGTKLALCFWRALRRELTTSVSWTPRTLKCFVQARRTPCKVTVQWPKSSNKMCHTNLPQRQPRPKFVEKPTMSLHMLKSGPK